MLTSPEESIIVFCCMVVIVESRASTGFQAFVERIVGTFVREFTSRSALLLYIPS